MRKITFEDTTITKHPYVIIDNEEYEVEDGTYDGGTDLNADTFNTMQDNIEEAIEETQNVELIAISDEAPLECETGDKYYNTEDNLVYTAIGTNTWSEDGEEPISGIFYILFSEQSSYSYDGTTLVSVGGGTEDIIISEDEPTTDDWKLWIDTGEIGSAASEITNEYSTSTGKGYSANYVNNLHTYSTTEQRVGTWIDGKPIYRKTYSLTSGSYSGNVVVDNIPTNLDKLIRFDGFGYQSNDSAWIPIPAPNTNAFTYQIEVYVLSSKLYVGLGSNRTLGSMYITIEYTKTTD